jgi:single-strand DNA-binding protein
MLNKVFLMGRVTRDIDLKHTTSDVPVCTFSIAVDRDYKDKQTGEKSADFFECTAWRNTAEFINKYVSKGSLVVVVGRLQNQSWTDKEGNPRRTNQITIEDIYFAGSRPNRTGDETTQPTYQKPVSDSPATSSGSFEEINDEDGMLPF